ncbi:MATE family efflux transporter [Garciella nitratireducens]|uniref:Probable multidrug resistance protein NorM n=1 Tax=Garciella nitratireducens DSM 15102 TaxID=1121911 RepID=A0A1T4PNJ8_9FIRM|nr:MATE family efflux transporter [Garciella nitratireducens]SJZ93019.1 putative efflux protein, MATE family [Garciella nitratireducens DSM 15102]
MENIDLTKGNVTSVLTKLALPVMGSSLLQFTYNIVDMLLVGGLGSDAVASIGSSSFFISLGYAIHALVPIGTGIKVSHALGQKNEIEVKKYINVGIILNVLLSITYGLILLLAGKHLIRFLDVGNPIVEKNAYDYLALHAPILFFNFFNVLYTRLLGSYGDNKLAFKINTIGILINVILDPLFIYVLDYGVIGAALGTLFANLLIFILFLITSKGNFKFHRQQGISPSKIKEVTTLGIPNTFQRILFTLINILLAKIIAIYGSDAIAAQKIGLQIESVTYTVIGGLNVAVASFTGQNFGAKKYKRILEGYHSALKIGIFYTGCVALVFLFFNVPIIQLFIREEATVSIASSYLNIIAFSEIFSAVEMISNGLFTGIGKPKIPSIISIVFTSLRIPMALLLSRLLGIRGVWISISFSSVLKGIVSYFIYQYQHKKGI